jgi:hypothetical protein
LCESGCGASSECDEKTTRFLIIGIHWSCLLHLFDQ